MGKPSLLPFLERGRRNKREEKALGGNGGKEIKVRKGERRKSMEERKLGNYVNVTERMEEKRLCITDKWEEWEVEGKTKRC
jgi:hypothetical protein